MLLQKSQFERTHVAPAPILAEAQIPAVLTLMPT